MADQSPQPSTSSSSKTRAKPSKTLPTNRVPFPKQLELARAYAAASEKTGGAVTNQEVGKFIDLADSTVGTTNAFFCDVGLLHKAENGGYMPSPTLIEHFKVYQLSPDRSWAKLAPLFEKSWIGQELIPKMKFRPLDESEAITDLALAAGADKAHYPLLKVGIDWLVQVGIANREAGQLRLNTQAPAPDPVAPSPVVVRRGSFTDLVNSDNPPFGGINFAINLNVEMKEMAGWPAANISAFFAGVAQVLAAKSAAEKTKQ